MFYFIVSVLFTAGLKDRSLVNAWDPSNFTFNPGPNYQLVWKDEFENVGPIQAIINGQPAYAPNPKNWVHEIGMHISGGIQNYTDSIYNAYVQNNQLTIVAIKDGYTSGRLTSKNRQEFTFGIWAAKIRLPYGQGMWPAWWLLGNGDKYHFWEPTIGEMDILEMVGGSKPTNFRDRNAYSTLWWNNASNSMNPATFRNYHSMWQTPDNSMLHNHSLVYWLEWTPLYINMGINEFIYFQFNTTNIPQSINPVWAFMGKWPFYMILNIAIGGDWAGPPDNTTVWPQQMVVDWVAVYQQKGLSMIHA